MKLSVLCALCPFSTNMGWPSGAGPPAGPSPLRSASARRRRRGSPRRAARPSPLRIPDLGARVGSSYLPPVSAPLRDLRRLPRARARLGPPRPTSSLGRDHPRGGGTGGDVGAPPWSGPPSRLRRGRVRGGTWGGRGLPRDDTVGRCRMGRRGDVVSLAQTTGCARCTFLPSVIIPAGINRWRLDKATPTTNCVLSSVTADAPSVLSLLALLV